MYSNQCTKCGTLFETKNPKRVICPNCLYPEASAGPSRQGGGGQQGQQKVYSFGGQQQRQGQGGRPQQGGGYNRGPGGPRPQGGRPQQGGGYNRGPGGPRPQGQGGYNRGPGGPRPGGPGGRPGGFNRGPGGRPGGGRPGGPGRGGPKKLLVSKEQLLEIEKMYKAAMPLPNPDIHEIIGEKIDLAPSKVFFGINLIRDKMKLPKLEYPKRKLAVSPEQLSAIETLYESFLPLPPVGVHKIMAKQLKIDEWRVHVAIGLVRKNRNMPRWNEERDDIPETMKEPKGKKPHPGGDKPPAKPAEKTEGNDSDDGKKKEAVKVDTPEKPAEKPAKEAATDAESEAEKAPKKKPAAKKAAPKKADATEDAEDDAPPAKKPTKKAALKAKKPADDEPKDDAPKEAAEETADAEA